MVYFLPIPSAFLNSLVVNRDARWLRPSAQRRGPACSRARQELRPSALVMSHAACQPLSQVKMLVGRFVGGHGQGTRRNRCSEFHGKRASKGA